MIEQEDKNKLLNFELERLNNVMKLIEIYTIDIDTADNLKIYVYIVKYIILKMTHICLL